MPIEGHQTMATASRKGTVADLETAMAALRRYENRTNDPIYPINTSIAQYEQKALHLAASHGNIEVITYLIDNGADIDIRDSNGNTPAHRAAIHHKEEALNLLFHNGANRSLINHDGLTPEAAGFPVAPYQAIVNNNSKSLNTLLTPSQHLYPRRDDADNAGNTLLHHAVMKKNTDCVDVLLKRKVNPLLKNKTGTTPGVLAARRGSLELADKLHSASFLPTGRLLRPT